MTDEAPSLDEVRRRLIELLEADEWRITEKAERSGRAFLGEPSPSRLNSQL